MGTGYNALLQRLEKMRGSFAPSQLERSMGNRRPARRRRSDPGTGRSRGQESQSSGRGPRILLPALAAAFLLLIAGTIVVVMKPERIGDPILDSSLESAEAPLPQGAAEEAADEATRTLELLGLPDDPSPQQIVNGLLTQLARKDHVLAAVRPGRVRDPRDDPILRSAPVPGHAARVLAERIPEDAPPFALALKAIGQSRFPEANTILQQLAADLNAEPNAANEDVARLLVARADVEYYAGRFAGAVAGYRAALPMFPRDPIIRYNLARALIRTPPPGDAPRLVEAIQILGELESSAYDRTNAPVDWALVQLATGTAMWNIPLEDATVSRTRAIEHYEAAMEVFTQTEYPAEWAHTQASLGQLLMRRPDGDRAENLARAMEHLRQAMSVYTREEWPRPWSGLQIALGDAYSALPAVRPDNLPISLKAAILSYGKALSVLGRDQFPAQWASAKIGQGNAYSELSAVVNAVENLTLAITHFEEALTAYDQEGYPADRAVTLNILGTAYMSLVEADVPAKREQHVTQAIRYFESAAEGVSATTHAFEWASAQANLGSAYSALRQGDSQAHRHLAAECFERAGEVFTADRHPEYHQKLQDNLAKVRTSEEDARQP